MRAPHATLGRIPATPRRTRLIVCVVAAIVVLVAPASRALAQGTLTGNVGIRLDPSIRNLPADGKSRTRIRIEVRTRDDQPVADGTPIICRVDNGLLGTSETDKSPTLTVITRSGHATVYCSSDTPGPATITARFQESRTQITIQFLPKGEAARRHSRVVNVHGGWVAYFLELNIIRARDGVRAQFGNMVFHADRLEVRIDEQTMRGWGVRIKRRSEELEGEDFYFELGTGRGVLRRFGDEGVERVAFTAFSLKPSAHMWQLPGDAFRADDREGDTSIICRSCKFHLGQKVALKHGALYAGMQKVFSFPPYWVIGLQGYSGASNSQVVGLSSEGGLAIDFPVFYRVSDQWAGSVKIQRGACGTSFVARDGWSLGLAEEYEIGDARGSIEAGGLFSSTWGLQWRDERPVRGNDQGFIDVAWPDHRNLFADAGMAHYADSYRFNLAAQYDKPWREEESYSVVGDWLTDPRELTGDADYRLGLSLGARRYAHENRKWVFQNELYWALDFDAWRIGKSTRITPSLSNAYTWDTAEYSTNSLRGDLRLTRQLGRRARMGLNYYLTYRNGDTTRPGLNQLLALNFSLSGRRKWSSYFSGTWDVTAGETYGYAALDYFVKPGWRLGLMGTHYAFDDSRFNDLEFELGRAIGNREIGLRYSLESSRISLELGSLGLMK